MFSIYSFASVAASPMLGRLVQLGYVRRVTLLLSGLLVVSGQKPKLVVSFIVCFCKTSFASLHNHQVMDSLMCW